MFAVCLPKIDLACGLLADAQGDRWLWRKYRLELWPLCVEIMRGGFLYACARDCGRIWARRCGRLAGIVCRMFASPQKNFCTFLEKCLQVSNNVYIFAYEIKQQTK